MPRSRIRFGDSSRVLTTVSFASSPLALEGMTCLFLEEVELDTTEPLLAFFHCPSLDFISHAEVMPVFVIGNPVDCNLVGDA